MRVTESTKRLPMISAVEDGCTGCTSPSSRRHFLGQVSAALLGVAAVSEVAAREVMALPLSLVSGIGSRADERTYPIPAGDSVKIDDEAEVILVRLHNRVMAFNLACPHKQTALNWRQNDMRFQCPRHQSKYQPDGTFISGRATRNMDRFAIRRAGDTVVVDLSTMFRSDQQSAEWAGAVVGI